MLCSARWMFATEQAIVLAVNIPPQAPTEGHRAVSSAGRAPRLHRGCRLCLLKIPNRGKRIELSASAPYRRGHDHDSFCPPDLIVGADVLFAPGPPQVLEPAPPV